MVIEISPPGMNVRSTQLIAATMVLGIVPSTTRRLALTVRLRTVPAKEKSRSAMARSLNEV